MKVLTKYPTGFWLVLLAAFIVCGCAHAQTTAIKPATANDADLYGRRIVLPTDAGSDLKASAADVADVLGRMTGAEFKTATEGAHGIVLLRSASPLAPADAVAKLKDKGREPFLIRSNDGSTLSIIANGDEGLRHGMYFYLEQLGVRWLAPGVNWEIVPRRQSVRLKLDTMMSPAFRNRAFFGTGGFAQGKLAYDPKGKLPTQWADWQRRNRFGGEYGLGGHSGEAFNTEKKTILLEHPEYLAKVDGKHVPWSLTAKLNVANPDAVKLYVDWTVDRFRRARQAQPNTFAVSVDPSDGGGHCNSEECKQIGNGSSSDLVFYVANQAAKAVRREFPDGWVNLYGYNEHSAPPSFALEPNVYVSVIPYGFNRSGLQPEEFIRAWGKKASRIGLYDYWSIPDWNQDLPTFDFANTPREKLRFWQANSVEGFSSESTYSTGAMGPTWYLSARLMWNPQANDTSILDEWFHLAFGTAERPMRRMIERWAGGFLLIGNELALSYSDLSEARKLAHNDAAVLRRIADYGRYLEYLRLRREWEMATPEAKDQALRTLVRYIWSIYDTGMIHSFRLYQLLTRGNDELHEAYGAGPAGVPSDPAAPGWAEVKPPTDEEIFRRLAEAAPTFPRLNFQSHAFRGPLVSVPREALPGTIPEPTAAMGFIGGLPVLAEVSPKANTLRFGLSSPEPMRVQLVDGNGARLHDTNVERSADMKTFQEVSVPLPGPGHYRLLLSAKDKNTAFNFAPSLQAGIALTLEPFTTSKGQPSPILYFYVPKGIKNIAVSNLLGLPEPMQPFLIDPSSQKISAQFSENNRILLFPVPDQMDGKVWGIANIVAPNGAIRFLNAPNYFAFSPSSLLVPKDALALGN
jgi:hypothetical protein